GTDGADSLDVGDARRVQHVGPGLFEGLKPPDGVVDARPVPEDVFRPRGQHEVAPQSARRLHRGRNAFHRMRELVDWTFRIAGVVLDRAAGKTGRLGGKDRLAGTFGAVALALFEIGG